MPVSSSPPTPYDEAVLPWFKGSSQQLFVREIVARLSHFLGFGLSDPGVAAFGCVVGARLVGGWLTI
jgi:hypothetical protein